MNNTGSHARSIQKEKDKIMDACIVSKVGQ